MGAESAKRGWGCSSVSFDDSSRSLRTSRLLFKFTAKKRAQNKKGLNSKYRLSLEAPPRGFEPRTQWLTATCSAY